MSRDDTRCYRCGVRIDWVSNWRDKRIAVDVYEPYDHARKYYIEIEQENFSEYWTHEYFCEPPPKKKEPKDGRDVRPQEAVRRVTKEREVVKQEVRLQADSQPAEPEAAQLDLFGGVNGEQ